MIYGRTNYHNLNAYSVITIDLYLLLDGAGAPTGG